MNTKTITTHAAHNYGAVLQAYALQQALISLGFNNEIIDFKRNSFQMFDKISFNFSKATLFSIYINFIKFIHYFDMKRNDCRFEDFIQNDLIHTKRYNSIDELNIDPPVADCFIAGSDQIWKAIDNNNFIPAFFLDFGDKNTRRVSYAASMGLYDLSAENEKQFIEYINTFKKISVREKDAKKYIEEKTAKKCHVHIDPVFLLDDSEWSKILCGNNISGKYILCYPLVYNELINISLDKLKALTGYSIVVIAQEGRTKIKGDVYIRDAGPKQFVTLIKNAEYVLTSSYHGTAFSMIFEKNFYSFITYHAPSRFTNMLNVFGLSNRIVTNIDDITLDAIDYTKVNSIKSEQCIQSYDYLKNIMSDENE